MLLSLSQGTQKGATKAMARPTRYWRVPPALLRNPSSPETFEGEGILAEYPAEAGLLLWQCYRDVLLWADIEDVNSMVFEPLAQPTRTSFYDLAALAQGALQKAAQKVRG